MKSTNSSRSRMVALTMVTVLALGVAVLTGIKWQQASPIVSVDVADARDTVLKDARTAAQILTTLDANDPDASIKKWQAATTGTLQEAVGAEGGDGYRELIATGKVSTTSTVKELAVESLDDERRNATVLVGLDIQLDPDAAKPTVQRVRLIVTMTRTADGWKASRLTPQGVTS